MSKRRHENDEGSARQVKGNVEGWEEGGGLMDCVLCFKSCRGGSNIMSLF
jgi:hypothetical protein